MWVAGNWKRESASFGGACFRMSRCLQQVAIRPIEEERRFDPLVARPHLPSGKGSSPSPGADASSSPQGKGSCSGGLWPLETSWPG